MVLDFQLRKGIFQDKMRNDLYFEPIWPLKQEALQTLMEKY